MSLSERAIIRGKLIEIVSYKKQGINTFKLFSLLGFKFDSRKDYSKFMSIIHKDRRDFHDGMLEEAINQAIEDGGRSRHIMDSVYRACLKDWEFEGRTFLYFDPDTKQWMTPLTLREKERLDIIYMDRQIAGLVNQRFKMAKLQQLIPYKNELKNLANKYEQ